MKQFAKFSKFGCNCFAAGVRLYFPVFLTICITVGSLRVSGQEFNWSWASQIHGTHTDAINKVNTNILGEILVTGTFYSTAVAWEESILINPYENNYNGIYVGKLNTQGALQWSKSIFCAPGNYHSDVYFRDAQLNAFGESFVSGKVYRSGIAIDTFILEMEEDYSASGFLTRFSKNGDVVWAHIFEDGTEVSSIVPDNNGGFYIMGNMYWYCDAIDFGDTIIYNTISTNQAYIAHYNNDNTVDWAKLVSGYVNAIKGQLTPEEELLVLGVYQVNGWLDTLSIDGQTVACPWENWNCDFFAKIDADGEVQWVKNIADQEMAVNGYYSGENEFTLLISFSAGFIDIQGDTIQSVNADGTGYLATFDLNGNFRNGDTIAYKFNGEFYDLYKSPAASWFIDFMLDDSVLCHTEMLSNTPGRDDPVLMQVDSNLNSIDCFQQAADHSAWISGISWDKFGNMIMTGSFSGDTLIFNTDELVNYQFHLQNDFYIAYAYRCDTAQFNLKYFDNALHAPDGADWKWYYQDTLMETATGQTLFPVAGGYYTVSVAQEDGCFLWSKPFLYPKDTYQTPIIVYPNPTHGDMTILLPALMEYCRIYDITGKLLLTVDPFEEIQLSLKYFSSGTYYIKAGNSDSDFSAKFIIL